MSLQGKVAVVTGSTSGIGLGIARAFARNGISLMINGLIDANEAEKLRAELAQEYGVKVLFSPADMSKPSEIEQMISETKSKLGRLDILVNNAGIQHVSSLENFPPAKWDAVISINLSSAFHTTQHALPLMHEQGWGRIINIASAHGLVASANKSAYVAAKHGLVGLTKVTALETATSGITCNAICPGWVLTPLVEKQIDVISQKEKITYAQAKDKLLSEKQPSKEFVTADQVGECALFLCSDAASQIRGISLNMDGGWVAQ